MRLKTYKMVMSILPKLLTFKWNISRTIWRIEVGDGSFFCIFHALSFELNLFFDRRCPLSYKFIYLLVSVTQHPRLLSVCAEVKIEPANIKSYELIAFISFLVFNTIMVIFHLSNRAVISVLSGILPTLLNQTTSVRKLIVSA